MSGETAWFLSTLAVAVIVFVLAWRDADVRVEAPDA